MLKSEADPSLSYRGLVLMRTKGHYLVGIDGGKELKCHIKNRFFEHTITDGHVAVGDLVVVNYSEEYQSGFIEKILPRSNIFQRYNPFTHGPQLVASNIDLLAIVMSVHQPDFEFNLLVRILAAANSGGIEPCVIINKADLAEPEALKALQVALRTSAINFVTHSIKEPKTKVQLKSTFESKRILLVGKSGVGKTSLLNNLFPQLDLKTHALSPKTGRGQHTTTLAYMYRLEDDFNIIDTPGISEFRPYLEDFLNFGQVFTALGSERYNCHFKSCLHISEPKCAIKSALSQGKLSSELYQGYVNFVNSERSERKIKQHRR